MVTLPLKMDTNDKKSGFQCPHCDKTVQSSNHLKTHIKWIHELAKDSHICDICSKTFAKTGDLKQHQRGHIKEKNFPCHVCGKSFKTKYYLIIHTRIHTGEKPFSCEQCGKTCGDPSSFKSHTKQHKDNREIFPCDKCGKVLKYKITLKHHMTAHTKTGGKEKVLFSNELKVEALKKVIEIGPKNTSTLMKIPYSSLRNWINICRGGHHCKECNIVFPYKASLEKHMTRNIHTSEGNPGPAEKKGPQVSLKEFMEEHGEEINFDEKVGTKKMDETLGVSLLQAPHHIEFLSKIYEEYGGSQLTSVLEEMKSMTEEDLDVLIAENSYREIFGEPTKSRNKELKKEEKLPKTEAKGEGEKLKKESSSAEHKVDVSEELVWEEIKIKGETIKEDAVDAEEKIKRGRLKCEQCGTKFRKENDLKSHLAIHTGTKDFVCPVCEKLFKTNPNLVRHQRTHGDAKPYKCNSCEATFSQSSSIKIHVERRHTEHTCNVCSEKFPNRPALIRHNITEHEGEKPHSCEECGKGLVTKRELGDHMRRHTGEKPFDCGKCGKLFMNTSGLRNHKKKHGIEDGTLTEEKLQRHEAKRICCEHCGKAFYQPSHHARHMKGHKGIKDFKCDQCEKAYTSGTSLSQHIDVVHKGKKSFACNECGHHFGRRGSLKAHTIQIHSKELPFRCEHCFDGFKEKQRLKNHMRKSHQEVGTDSLDTLAKKEEIIFDPVM